jgi:tetratricopeptide (TPR) repeat protein
MIVICSRHAAQSRWVSEEVRHFKSLGRAGRVFCLLVDDPDASFPASVLSEFDEQGKEIATGVEPLAADVRAGRDGKSGARLKLIAGMLGVGLDRLIRRDAARRQRRLVAVVFTALAGMVLASGLALYALAQRDFARQVLAATARDDAIRSRDEAEQVVDFLTGLFDLFDPGESLGNPVTARDVLGSARDNARSELADQPLTQARLLDTLGAVYEALGLFNEARELSESALATRRELLGDHHKETLASLAGLASVALNQGDYVAMEDYARQALAISRELYGDEHPETIGALSDLATALSGRGEYALAAQHSREALDMARRTPGMAEATLETYVRRAAIYLKDIGEYAQAEALYKESLALSRRVYGEPHPNVAFAMDNLALYYSDIGDPERAGPLYWEALEMLRRIYGPEHPEVAQTMGNVASFLVDTGGDLDQARSLLESAIAIDRRTRPDHEFLGDHLHTLAMIELDEGNYSAAEERWREALDIYARSLPDDDPYVMDARAGLGRALYRQDKLVEAETVLAEAHRLLQGSDGEADSLEQVIEDLADIYQRSGRSAEAGRLRSEAMGSE